MTIFECIAKLKSANYLSPWCQFRGWSFFFCFCTGWDGFASSGSCSSKPFFIVNHDFAHMIGRQKAFCACLSHQIVFFGQSIGLYGIVHTYNLTFTDLISTPLTSISGLLWEICTWMWKEAGYLWENRSTRFWGSMGTPPNGTTCGTRKLLSPLMGGWRGMFTT